MPNPECFPKHGQAMSFYAARQSLLAALVAWLREAELSPDEAQEEIDGTASALRQRAENHFHVQGSRGVVPSPPGGA